MHAKRPIKVLNKKKRFRGPLYPGGSGGQPEDPGNPKDKHPFSISFR